MKYLILLFGLCCATLVAGQNNSGIQLALLKYNGGGDWYANPTALGNLTQFANQQLGTDLSPEPATIDVGSSEIFNYPWLHMTGHGNVVFSDKEAENLRLYLNHPVYNQKYTFSSGVPKIHEHDSKPAQGLGLVWEGRVVCFYSYESDLGDGWEDASVHNDPEPVRRKALQMGANLIQYAFNL